jgi:hypothetical protein
MTNERIILNGRLALMRDGIIKGTGRYITVENEKGEEIQIEEPEELHTYAGWKCLNRQVKKGEKSIATMSIWKHISRQLDEKEEKHNKMFMTKAFFFRESQTEYVEKL